MASDAAEAILEARRARRILAPLGAIAPKTIEAGYAVQKEVALRLGGLPPAGFKIGATTKQMQAYLGLPGPSAGFTPKSGLRASPATARYADFLNPGAECEVAVRLARDIAPGPCTRDEAAAAVGEVFAAMEIVEKRYDDLGKLGTPTLIADQVFHAGGVLGTPVADWRAVDLAATRGRLSVDGQIRGEGRGADLLGHPGEGHPPPYAHYTDPDLLLSHRIAPLEPVFRATSGSAWKVIAWQTPMAAAPPGTERLRQPPSAPRSAR